MTAETIPQLRTASKKLNVRWYRTWSPTVDAAFDEMPHDILMDRDVVKIHWDYYRGKRAQEIGIFEAGGTVVGIVPVKKERYRWQLMLQHAMPYARFYVQPDYTGQALAAIHFPVNFQTVKFYAEPMPSAALHPQMSAVVDLREPFDALLKRKNYARQTKQCLRKTTDFVVREDQFSDLPRAIEIWAETWRSRGSIDSYNSRHIGLQTLQLLATKGALKTLSIYDQDQLVGMTINILDHDVLYFQATASLEAYRDRYVGILGLTKSFEWAYAHGMREYDLLPSNYHYKKNWAEEVPRCYRVAKGPFGSTRAVAVLETVEGHARQIKAHLTTRRNG